MAEQPEGRVEAHAAVRTAGVRAGDAASGRDAAPARDGSQPSLSGGAGNRPEALRPPATAR